MSGSIRESHTTARAKQTKRMGPRKLISLIFFFPSSPLKLPSVEVIIRPFIVLRSGTWQKCHLQGLGVPCLHITLQDRSTHSPSFRPKSYSSPFL